MSGLLQFTAVDLTEVTHLVGYFLRWVTSCAGDLVPPRPFVKRWVISWVTSKTLKVGYFQEACMGGRGGPSVFLRYSFQMHI